MRKSLVYIVAALSCAVLTACGPGAVHTTNTTSNTKATKTSTTSENINVNAPGGPPRSTNTSHRPVSENINVNAPGGPPQGRANK